jgi:hypothetical protein
MDETYRKPLEREQRDQNARLQHPQDIMLLETGMYVLCNRFMTIGSSVASESIEL